MYQYYLNNYVMYQYFLDYHATLINKRIKELDIIKKIRQLRDCQFSLISSILSPSVYLLTL